MLNVRGAIMDEMADRTGEDYADIWSVLVGTAFMLSVMSSNENVISKKTLRTGEMGL